MPCPPLYSPTQVQTIQGFALDITQFQNHFLGVGNVCLDWLRQSDEAYRDDEDPFKAFIPLWVAFNGWYGCISDRDQDRQQIESLCLDPQINIIFQDLLNEQSFRLAVDDFSNYWPIFNVKKLLRRANILNRPFQNRHTRVNYYLNTARITAFQPLCWKTHRDLGQDCPKDWQHTLKAIYQVRCNLLHGSKSAMFDADVQIVRLSYLILSQVFKATLRQIYGYQV